MDVAFLLAKKGLILCIVHGKSKKAVTAPGEDNINGELLKNGTSLLDKTIADIYHTAFENHEDLDINGGVLIATPKPNNIKNKESN